MKNLHYRTQSLPESVHQYNHLLAAQLGSSHHPDYGLQHHPGKLHSASAIKKRAALRRSQTSVADLLPHGVNHHRAPLAQGVYEAFLPPPNFNSIGLPTGAQLSCGMSRARSRTQSFYVPSHYMAPSSSHQLLPSSSHQLLPSSPYPSLHHSQANMLGMDQCSSSLASQWYHRSVPNLHPRSLPYLPQAPLQPAPQAKSITTPLFVDCSVEYDLGEQPVIPADSEPLLSIHPEYVARSLSSSPYSMFQSSLASSRPSPQAESASKSMPDMASRLQRRSHPRPSPHTSRSGRPSPRARASLAAKLEATRKLSVESRDSGIGLMNSAGTLSYPQAYSSSPTEPQTYLPHLQSQFTGNFLPTASNKRFGISDLVTGLLCCSAPHQPAPSHLSKHVMLDIQTESCDINTNAWTQHHQALAFPASSVSSSSPPDARTVEWVVASQRAMACQSTCQSRDCNEGFCYNVWNNMVHV
jgi:hypothetical protein